MILPNYHYYASEIRGEDLGPAAQTKPGRSFLIFKCDAYGVSMPQGVVRIEDEKEANELISQSKKNIKKIRRRTAKRRALER